ncbi:MAG TPA: VOC family protein [Anaeromyxobacteraceae bacterium]|nr:VOC family protein [Anaeromyxobacteraceae bacterium]
MTRARFHAAAICALLVLILAPPAGAAEAGRGSVLAVGCIGLTVSDLDRATDFYERVLSFRREGDGLEVTGERWESLTGVFGLRARIARLRLGGECLELTEYLAPRGRPAPADARSNDGWFQHVAIVVADMDEAYRRLRAAKVEHASSGPQRLPDWNPNAGGIRAFYFKDPDRHVLEVIWFPRGKGDPRWQAARSDGALFLGIDHTAIVVADTEASLRFWRDALGFRVAGGSENWGVEQEHLNNVFGARLRITGLRAPEGPGVEFLEYLAPRDGRPYPPGARATDLIHWHTGVQVRDVDSAARATRAAGQGWVSPGAVDVLGPEAGTTRAARVRDPDGHVVELRAEAGAAGP